MAVHPNKRRKRLMMSDEEFFSHCLMALGPPRGEEIRQYRTVKNNFELLGAYPYLREHPWGQRFMIMLTTAGEAKCRAAKWLYAYIKWWDQQQLQRVKKERYDAAKKVTTIQQAALPADCRHTG